MYSNPVLRLLPVSLGSVTGRPGALGQSVVGVTLRVLSVDGRHTVSKPQRTMRGSYSNAVLLFWEGHMWLNSDSFMWVDFLSGEENQEMSLLIRQKCNPFCTHRSCCPEAGQQTSVALANCHANLVALLIFFFGFLSFSFLCHARFLRNTAHLMRTLQCKLCPG